MSLFAMQTEVGRMKAGTLPAGYADLEILKLMLFIMGNRHKEKIRKVERGSKTPKGQTQVSALTILIQVAVEIVFRTTLIAMNESGSWDAYLASPADFAGGDDIITNLAKERERRIEIIEHTS